MTLGKINLLCFSLSAKVQFGFEYFTGPAGLPIVFDEYSTSSSFGYA
jgi:hypothetical protein